jgi:uroporphyrinogen III methyltransferase / synthase
MGTAAELSNTPLANRRVMITRPRRQAAELVRRLEACGASIIAFPAIRTLPALDQRPLHAAIERLPQYDWVVFTSANGVERFLDAAAALGHSPDILAGIKVAVAGPATAASLQRRGLEPTLVSGQYTGDALAEALCTHHRLSGARILLPRAERARPDLQRRLSLEGAWVEEVVAYRTVASGAGAAAARAALDVGGVDAITFLSPSAVDAFVASVGTEVGRAVVAVIGPVTAEAARKHGLEVRVEARDHTVAGLIQALVAHMG